LMYDSCINKKFEKNNHPKMRLSILVSVVVILSSENILAFAPSVSSRNGFFTLPISRTMRMSTTSESSVNIVVTGNNIAVTPALNTYVNKKLDNIISKLSSGGAVQECKVHLTVNKNPKVKLNAKAEVVTSLKGTVLRCAIESADMYSSIDSVTDRLCRKLIKYKERRLEGFHGGPNMSENLMSVLDSVIDEYDDTEVAVNTSDDEFVDPEKPIVTKIKSYDLSSPISLEEATFALDYVDHDFYVFRDSETNEINVIYKRNAGGYGLIQPSV